ncbi:MAG: PilZ domain-containing protein [Candidatus Omnitrophica bacterium]|nr:PilZ domain-containing protein [Candidatus Omnitrophota bacterium]
MQERRMYPRVAVNKEASFYIENRLSPIPCRVEDISLGGLKVSMHKSLLPEVFSNISLSIPDVFDFNAGTQVAWQDEYEGRCTYGLIFNRLGDDDKDRISGYIQDNSFKGLKEHWWKDL